MIKRVTTFCALALVAVSLAAAAAPVASAASPVWDISMRGIPTNQAPGRVGSYLVSVFNTSSVASDLEPTVEIVLPPGVVAKSAGDRLGFGIWSCPDAAGASQFTCTLKLVPVGAHEFAALSLIVAVEVGPGVSGRKDVVATVSGGGAAESASTRLITDFTTDDASFGITEFENWASDRDGSPAVLAGSHPDLTTKFELSTKRYGENESLLSTTENLKNVRVELPPGLIGDPTALPTCPLERVALPGAASCPPEAQVGVVDLPFSHAFDSEPSNTAVYNIPAPKGSPGRFAFNTIGVVTLIEPSVRSNGDFGITASVRNASQSLGVFGSRVTLWGVPADPTHDALRVNERNEPNTPSTASRVPFLSLPTQCSRQALETRLALNSWQDPSNFLTASTDSNFDDSPFKIEGCNQLEFDPQIEVRPTTNLADSPSGLDVRVHVPQSEDPDGLATAHLRDATVTLPAGMTVNPSSANGLDACSPSQVGLITPVGQVDAHFDESPVSCPNGSKLGTVQIDTQLLDHPMKGDIYLASQNQNPFGSLLALYIVVEDAQSGITLKLAGHPVPDPGSGQLAVSFDQNPQLPFEDLRVNLFTGPRAALKTPLACGSYTTTSQMVPWSAPEGATAAPSDTFAITRGAGGSSCLKSDSEAPNKPSFSAGTSDPAAGAYAPFVLKLAREDGTAPLKSIDATLPKGLLGKLAGIPYCSDGALANAASRSGRDERASASCPSASQVGSVTVGAGAGSNPLYVGGKAYLAGPYKGAPLSLAIVTPAVAGPFDLGTVVVRTRLEVNPESAQIHAVSDELPTILRGIPLDIRSIAVNMDKPQFTLNPTSCDPTSVNASALSVFGQSAGLSDRFQVGGCKALGFKPKLAISLKGGTRRGQNPALRAVLNNRSGDANIAKALVSLPHSEFLAQNHIKTICTRVQFSANACPAESIYGKVRAFSPLLDQPLEGSVYLRSSSNPLPDLVADLNGQIRVNVVGRIDSVKGGIRTSFESVPDAPVSKFVIEMAGGKKSLLENSRNLCASTNRADVKMDGQNGKTYDSAPVVKATGCKKAKKKRGGGKKKAKSHKGARR